MMTNPPVHPKEPDVLKLMGSTYGGEMLPSLLAQQLAPCLGTIQSQPITLGATSPAEEPVVQRRRAAHHPGARAQVDAHGTRRGRSRTCSRCASRR